MKSWISATFLPLMLLASMALAAEPPQEVVVSTELCSGLWLVELEWSPEGKAPQQLTAVFDTGGSSGFIDPDGLERISGKRIEEGKRVRMEDLSVAGKPFNKFRVRVRDLDHLSRALGRELDVFLPFQAFASYLLILDYPAVEMRIVRGELPRPDGVTVFSAKGKDSRPWLEMRVGGKKRKLLLDSGASGGVSIRRKGKFDWASEPVPVRLVQGMNEARLQEMGRLREQVTVGPLVLDDPVVSLTDDTELLGAQVLQHCVATFDQENRRVRLEPATLEPVRLASVRGTGAVFGTDVESWVVVRVAAGSPAEAAGLRKGDRLTHVDGVPVFELGCREIEREEPDSLVYGVERDGVRWEVAVGTVVLVD